MAYTAIKEVEGLPEKLKALEALVRDLQAEVAELKAKAEPKAKAKTQAEKE